MGIVYGMGVYEKGEIKNTKAMLEAYEIGKSVWQNESDRDLILVAFAIQIGIYLTAFMV